jgi:hypothetical protein
MGALLGSRRPGVLPAVSRSPASSSAQRHRCERRLPRRSTLWKTYYTVRNVPTVISTVGGTSRVDPKASCVLHENWQLAWTRRRTVDEGALLWRGLVDGLLGRLGKRVDPARGPPVTTGNARRRRGRRGHGGARARARRNTTGCRGEERGPRPSATCATGARGRRVTPARWAAWPLHRSS